MCCIDDTVNIALSKLKTESCISQQCISCCTYSICVRDERSNNQPERNINFPGTDETNDRIVSSINERTHICVHMLLLPRTKIWYWCETLPVSLFRYVTIPRTERVLWWAIVLRKFSPMYENFILQKKKQKKKNKSRKCQDEIDKKYITVLQRVSQVLIKNDFSFNNKF